MTLRDTLIYCRRKKKWPRLRRYLIERTLYILGLEEQPNMQKWATRVLIDYINYAYKAASHGYKVRISDRVWLVPVMIQHFDERPKITRNRVSSRYPNVEFDILVIVTRMRRKGSGYYIRMLGKHRVYFRSVYESDLVYELIRDRI